MAEYISREAAIKAAERAYDAWNLAMATADGRREINLVYKRQELCKAVASVFDSVPAADVAPVIHGHWVWKRRFRGEVKTYEGEDEFGVRHRITVDERRWVDEPFCSVCGKLSMADVLNGCPNCCAAMDEGAK